MAYSFETNMLKNILRKKEEELKFKASQFQYFNGNKLVEILHWCEENFDQESWLFDSGGVQTIIYIINEIDTMAFKLRWM